MFQSFLFVTSEIEFQEASEKGAKVFGTFMELEKPSSNGRVYRFVEGARIAKSLIGRTVRYGADWLGMHILKNPVIGIVKNAWRDGNKIKGIVNFTDKDIITQLKNGVKFLFSVGGVAQFGETVRRGVTRLYNAVCTHLQLLPDNPSGAGFPSAKIHKVIAINESVMISRNREECNGNCPTCDGSCGVLGGIEETFEEAKRIEAEVLNMAIARDIASVVEDVICEPWKYFNLEEKS